MARARLGLLAAVVAAAAVAGAYLSDCSGFGVGSGVGGPAPPATPEVTPEQPRDSDDDARTIEVEGSSCRIADSEATACDAACATLVAGGKAPVVVDGSAGSHKIVEELRRCLESAQIDVRMASP